MLPRPYTKIEEYQYARFVERLNEIENGAMFEAFRMLAHAYMKKLKEMPQTEERRPLENKFADIMDARNIWLHDRIQNLVSSYYQWDEAETEAMFQRLQLEHKTYKRLVELINEKESARREVGVKNPLNISITDAEILRMIELVSQDDENES